MNTVSRSDVAAFAATHETSLEVAQAILEQAERIWDAPTAEEMAAITARAFELADDSVSELQWGQETIYRA